MYLIDLDLGQGIWSKVIKWSPLGGKYNELHPLLIHMKVFSILFALPAVGIDFVHEFGASGDLIVPCCIDMQTATQVSGVQEGEYFLSNQRHSHRVQLGWEVLALWRVDGQLQRTLSRKAS